MNLFSGVKRPTENWIDSGQLFNLFNSNKNITKMNNENARFHRIILHSYRTPVQMKISKRLQYKLNWKHFFNKLFFCVINFVSTLNRILNTSAHHLNEIFSNNFIYWKKILSWYELKIIISCLFWSRYH